MSWADPGRLASGRRMKTTQRDIEKLIPVATTIPTTAAASRWRPKKPSVRADKAQEEAHRNPQGVAQGIGQELAEDRPRPRVVERERRLRVKFQIKATEDRQRPGGRQRPRELEKA